MHEFLKLLREWNDACREARDAFPAIVTAEKRTLTDDEDTEFRRLAAEVAENDERIAEIELQLAAEARSGKVALALGQTVEVKSEPLTYNQHNRFQHSYFRDLGLALVGHDAQAMDRLQRHAAEMDVEVPRIEREREAAADRQIRALGFDPSDTFIKEQRTNPNRTDGQGGYFVPPLWLDEYIPLLRAGRPFANAVRNLPLPDGTDSINIPAVSTGTTAAVQTADGASVSSTDATDTYVSAGVKTIAGQQDIALQLLEQSPYQFDDVIFTDLTADYNKKLDAQLWTGSGSSGQCTGVDNVSSTNTTTYTDASPTVPELWVPLAKSLSLLSQNRFDFSSTRFWMHPRRWFWILAALDSSNRPLVVPSSIAQNGIADPELAAQGHVGVLSLGAPVSIDANISTSQTDGSSGEDRIYAINTNDLMLFEGALRTRALPEVLSGTLQVRLQVYNYFAFLTRYAKAISWIAGTGQAAPSGY